METKLKLIANRIINCQKCELSTTTRHSLPGEGDCGTRFFLVALSPGEQEDIENRMFIGPFGKMLNKLLEEVGIERDTLYISNLIKCNLPQNRKPKIYA